MAAVRPDLDLRRIRFFVEVVRQGGFSPAAKVLFATQSAVSKAVKLLESELGLRLLDRVGTRVQLTDAGHVVFERGVKLLAAAAELRQELAELDGLPSQTLRIGFGRMGTSALLARTIEEFRRRFPRVKMDLQVYGRRELVARMHAGDFDLVVSPDTLPEEFGGEVVLRDRLVALLPGAHPLAGRETLSLQDLHGMPLILFEDGSSANALLLQEFARAGSRPEVVACSSQVELLFELVDAGVGAAFMPGLLEASRPHRRVQARALQPPGLPWTVRVAWRREGIPSTAARAWVEIAAGQAQEVRS